MRAFIDRYVKEIKSNNAAVFLGAGFSKSSGYVDWNQLLKRIADELDLDIKKEKDLPTLAQYYFNKNNNRSVINDIISEEFSCGVEISENHRILARLPIFNYWTTNYDTLIEDALAEVHKRVDVKYNNKHLSVTRPRDAIVYKMHGDQSNPDETIIIRDDYELYYRKYAPFITTLSGDLISKTFLFIGFSFTDPNIDYILSKIRVDYGDSNKRQHYALMKRVNIEDCESKADYEYLKRKQELFLNDLSRYCIKPLMIDDYDEITTILKNIEIQINTNNIFISGSAASYGEWGKEEADSFIKGLSSALIREGYNIVSGFGLGIGNCVIIGALEEIYCKTKMVNEDRLILRPFPQEIVDEEIRKVMWRNYRQDMIARTGISVFIFGNKTNNENGEVELADGVIDEFKISLELKNFVIPVGCTGYVAKKLWEDVNNNFNYFYPEKEEELKPLFEKLNISMEKDEIICAILKIIKIIKRCY